MDCRRLISNVIVYWNTRYIAHALRATPAGVRGRVHPGGGLLTSASGDASVRLWDVAAGAQTRV